MLGSALTQDERAGLIARIESDGGGFVGQEAVTLSTTPVYVGGKLEPRPASLRVYLARTPEGWTVMPGGFARVGSSLDPTAIAMQRGGQAADVWVVSDKPVERETLLPQERDSFARTMPGSLPSRAADNLIWLGRYIERSEDTVRILRAYHVRLAETSDPDMPLLADIRDYLEPFGIDARSGHSAGTDRHARQRRLQRRADPRPLLARWLAGAASDLSKTIHQFRHDGGAGRRRDARDDGAAAQARWLLRPAAREHVPLHRLALPRDRPAARARHPDRPHACPADRARKRPTARST